MIAGNPVSRATSVTARPAAASALAVPPVETSSKSCAARSRARSTMPVLSETESSARRAFCCVICSGGQPVLAQFLAQGAAIDAEDGRCPALVAGGVVHDGLEQRQFDLA